ncbi:CHASE2 domain-containing protein [Xanthomonas sacchari]|nr:CHASE2 domain-containing protein [Xanthomonas sacchari]UYK65511.1 CHASE2 domain-containing protein [Xanthomonas sacchari]
MSPGALDNALYDAAIAQAPRPADPRMLLIAIDDRSLQTLGQWPWRRDLHARLLDRLSAAGTERVALDLLCSASPTCNTPTTMRAWPRRCGAMAAPCCR